MKNLLSKLNVETYILDLPECSEDPNLQGFDYRMVDMHTMEVDIPKENSLNNLFQQLNDKNVQIMSMRNKANRLEELFVRLVENGRNPKNEKTQSGNEQQEKVHG